MPELDLTEIGVSSAFFGLLRRASAINVREEEATVPKLGATIGLEIMDSVVPSDD